MTNYHGSCACGLVHVEVQLDLANGTFKCNCDVCTKTRFWGAAVPRDRLTVTSGQDALTTYASSVDHLFCRRCGVKVFSQGTNPAGAFACVNLATLDDLPPQELAGAPVQFMDGRAGNWDKTPDFTAHL